MTWHCDAVRFPLTSQGPRTRPQLPPRPPPPARRGFCQCRPRRPPERGRGAAGRGWGRRDRIQPEPALHLTHRSDSFRERRMCWRWFSEGQPRAPGRRPLPPTRWLRLPQGGRGPCPPGSPAVCANHGGGRRRVGRAAGADAPTFGGQHPSLMTPSSQGPRASVCGHVPLACPL